MDFVVSCKYFTFNGHSVTYCFLWQGAFYAQDDTGNANNLNPLVFQKLTFRFPTLPIFVTVTDVSVGSFYSPIHFIVFAWVLLDCITIQCLNITSNGTLLPCYGRTWKICHKNDVILTLKGLLKVLFFSILYRILRLKLIILYLWDIKQSDPALRSKGTKNKINKKIKNADMAKSEKTVWKMCVRYIYFNTIKWRGR